MSENYESVLEAARRLSPEEQRHLAGVLLNLTGEVLSPSSLEETIKTVLLIAELVEKDKQAATEPGKFRRHFGAWDSGDERSADNERIDRDLEKEYNNSR